MNEKIEKVSNYENFDDWIVDILKLRPNGAEHYLEIALEEFLKDGNEEAFRKALRHIEKAKSTPS